MALPQISKKKILFFIIGILFLGVTTAPSIYFYQQYQATQQKLDNPAEVAKEEVKRVLASVGKLMILPGDEDPTVATVADFEKLKDQLFFANSQNGDKVIIFTKARKAILYRPLTNKIIEVAPVNLGQPPTASVAGEQVLPSPSPTLRPVRTTPTAAPSAPVSP